MASPSDKYRAPLRLIGGTLHPGGGNSGIVRNPAAGEVLARSSRDIGYESSMPHAFQPPAPPDLIHRLSYSEPADLRHPPEYKKGDNK